MKVVYNSCWGGFRVPSALRPHNKETYWGFCMKRTDSKLIAFVEERGGEWVNRRGTTVLNIADIPDSATDWMIQEYDGLETVYAVIEGKIKRWHRCRDGKGEWV